MTTHHPATNTAGKNNGGQVSKSKKNIPKKRKSEFPDCC